MNRTMLLIAATLLLAKSGWSEAQNPQTLIVGTIREAVTFTPISGAIVSGARDTVITDSHGRFALRVPRATHEIGFAAAGYLDFRYPMLILSSDTLRIDTELRTDPPAPGSYVVNGFLPPVCVRLEGPDSLTISNGCRLTPPPGYVRQIFKHNPWSPYFGRSVDGCGVIILTPIGGIGSNVKGTA